MTGHLPYESARIVAELTSNKRPAASFPTHWQARKRKHCICSRHTILHAESLEILAKLAARRAGSSSSSSTIRTQRRAFTTLLAGAFQFQVRLVSRNFFAIALPYPSTAHPAVIDRAQKVPHAPLVIMLYRLLARTGLCLQPFWSLSRWGADQDKVSQKRRAT